MVRAEFLKAWSIPLSDPPITIADGFSAAQELPNGEIVTVGSVTNWYTEWFIAIVRADGTVKWQVVLDEPLKSNLASASGGRVSIVADQANNPIVAYPCDPISAKTCLAKFNSTDGTVLWREPAESPLIQDCSVRTSDTAGFYRICPNGPIQRRDWNGSILWQITSAVSLRIALPLRNGNFVLANYTVGAGTFDVLDQATGQSVRHGTVSGDVYGAATLTTGGFLLHTQRATGPSTYASTLDRFSDLGVSIWRQDFPVSGGSFPGQPLVVGDNLVIRLTYTTSVGYVRIATNLAGQFIWQRPADPFSSMLVANGNVYGVNGGDVSRIDPASGAGLNSVTVAGSQHSIIGLTDSLLVFRQATDAVGTVIEKYSPEMVRTWRAALFSVQPQLLSANAYPPNYQYVPRLCDRLRVKPSSPNFELFLSRRTGTNSNGYQLRERRQISAGSLVDTTGFADGAICASSQTGNDDLIALSLDGHLRRLSSSGAVVWSVIPDGALSIYATFTTELSNGLIAVAASMSTSGTWMFDQQGVMQFPRVDLATGPSGLRAGGNGDYFILLNNSSVTHVTNQGAAAWNKQFGDLTCFTGGIRDMITAKNGDLLVAYNTCVNAAHIVRVTPAGSVLWESALSTPLFSGPLRMSKLVESATGGIYAIGCSSTSNSANAGEYSFIRALSANGVVEWSKDIDVFVNASECATAIDVSTESIYLISASGDECGRSAILRMNEAGTIEFADARSLAEPQVVPTEIGVTSTNSLIVAGNGYDFVSRRKLSTVREILPRAETCDFDLDGDGTVTMNTDVVPLLKAMFGFGAFAPSVSNATCALGPELIAARDRSAIGIPPYRSQTTVSADVDQDGTVNPLIDGLLLVRAQLGIPENRLAQGIQFPASAARTNSATIAPYLRSCGVAVSQ